MNLSVATVPASNPRSKLLDIVYIRHKGSNKVVDLEVRGYIINITHIAHHIVLISDKVRVIQNA